MTSDHLRSGSISYFEISSRLPESWVGQPSKHFSRNDFDCRRAAGGVSYDNHEIPQLTEVSSVSHSQSSSNNDDAELEN